MPSFQPKLSLKVSQRQVLTPGLVQMVSVLALNKLELKEMISAEVVENPVLEEVEETVPLLDDVEAKLARLEGTSSQGAADEPAAPERDPFDEIDFGAYFQEYLDPGYRTGVNHEDLERSSFENFLSVPGTLTDHLCWQLGARSVEPRIRRAAELIIGNLDEAGYLTASDDELLEALSRELAEIDAPKAVQASTNGHLVSNGNGAGVAAFTEEFLHEQESQPHSPELREVLSQAVNLVQHLDPPGIATRSLRECLLLQLELLQPVAHDIDTVKLNGKDSNGNGVQHGGGQPSGDNAHVADSIAVWPLSGSAYGWEPVETNLGEPDADSHFSSPLRREAGVHGVDTQFLGAAERPGPPSKAAAVWEAAHTIVNHHLQLLLKRDIRELSRTASLKPELAQEAIDLIRRLDPHPGHKYNVSDVRLIEPDVAFVKRDDEYVVVMNEEDLPTLRLNRGYRRMLMRSDTAKDVREYVKERYKSAIQLMRSIEQRKNTIQRTCESIVQRQREFLERGVDYMRPMMIKEVAEEIGVHPSTVSRAVSNKYVHTPQGVFELRFFFSEAVAGPEGSSTPLMLLKRKVKKIIEEEDASRPLTDDLIATMLQQQGINVTRRTVAKYREDMNIPSTHQRRVRH